MIRKRRFEDLLVSWFSRPKTYSQALGRPHGIDGSAYRLLDPVRPENPPRPIDFVFWCGVWGTTRLNNWPQNREVLKTLERPKVYGAYRFMDPQAQADALMECGEEVNAKVHAIDYENYAGYTLSDKDIPIMIAYYNALEDAGKKVVLYCGRWRWTTIESYDPEFASRAELWITYPTNDPNTSDFGSYETRINRPFNSMRYLQYTWSLNGFDYGVNNSKLDGNVYVNPQPLNEWLDEEEPEEPMTGYLEDEIYNLKEAVVDLKDATLATKFVLELTNEKLDIIIQKLDQPTEPPPVEPPPVDETVGAKVLRERDGQLVNVYLFYNAQTDPNKPPLYQIYQSVPGSTAVEERLFVAPNTVVRVFTPGIKGDGERIGYLVDKTQLEPVLISTTPIPDDVDLYVDARFIIGFVA